MNPPNANTCPVAGSGSPHKAAFTLHSTEYGNEPADLTILDCVGHQSLDDKARIPPYMESIPLLHYVIPHGAGSRSSREVAYRASTQGILSRRPEHLSLAQHQILHFLGCYWILHCIIASCEQKHARLLRRAVLPALGEQCL